LKQAFADGGAPAYWQRKLQLLNQVEEIPSAARRLQTALALLRLGQPDEAMTLLEHAVEGRTGMGVFLNVDPNFVALSPHPRFRALIKRIGIPSA
jgi:hypothetical protein